MIFEETINEFKIKFEEQDTEKEKAIAKSMINLTKSLLRRGN